MYSLSESPLEAWEKALGSYYADGTGTDGLLTVLNREHAKVSRWNQHLRQIESASSGALKAHSLRWQAGNKMILSGLEKAYLAVSYRDGEALDEARKLLQSGQEMLKPRAASTGITVRLTTRPGIRP